MRRSANWADSMEPTRHIRVFGTFGSDWPSSDLVELDPEDLSFLGPTRGPAVSCGIPEEPDDEDAVTVIDLPPSEQVTRPIPEVLAPPSRPASPPRRPQGQQAFRGYVPARSRVARPRAASGPRLREVIVLFASLCVILVLLAMMAGLAAGMLV